MARSEAESTEQQEPISGFGLGNTDERRMAVNVLKMIRDAEEGNGDITINQAIVQIELQDIAQKLSQTTPVEHILKPEPQTKYIGSGPTTSRSKTPGLEHRTTTTGRPKPPYTPTSRIPQSPPPASEPFVETRRTVHRPARYIPPSKPASDSRHFKRPPVPEMGQGPHARNVLPPPVRKPDSID